MDGTDIAVGPTFAGHRQFPETCKRATASLSVSSKAMAIGSFHRPPPSSKVHWADVEDEDFVGPRIIPPPIVLGPDGNGIKRLIGFRIDGHGRMIKTTTTSRVRKLDRARLTKRALQRRAWPKFVDAAHQSNGILTMVSTEEILFQKPTAPGSTSLAEDARVAGDPFIGLREGGTVLMVCRTCGRKGDHCTARCPYKDLGLLAEDLLINRPATAEAPAAHDPDTKVKYMPPGLRGGAERHRKETRHRSEEYTVKVSNLSEDTHEPDLFDLFSVLGSVSHVHSPTYHNTSISKDYGFVTFSNKEDAEMAINKLDGVGYNNLIIRVEGAPWSSNCSFPGDMKASHIPNPEVWSIHPQLVTSDQWSGLLNNGPHFYEPKT